MVDVTVVVDVTSTVLATVLVTVLVERVVVVTETLVGVGMLRQLHAELT